MDKDIHFFFSCIIYESESSREDMKIKWQGKGKTLCPFPRNYNYLKVTSFDPVSSMSQAHLQSEPSRQQCLRRTPNSCIWPQPTTPKCSFCSTIASSSGEIPLPGLLLISEFDLSDFHHNPHWHKRTQRVQRKPTDRQSLENSVKDHSLHFLEQKVMSTRGRTFPAQAVQKVWGKEQEPSGSRMPPLQKQSVRRNPQRRCAQQPVTRDSEQGYGVRSNK